MNDGLCFRLRTTRAVWSFQGAIQYLCETRFEPEVKSGRLHEIHSASKQLRTHPRFYKPSPDGGWMKWKPRAPSTSIPGGSDESASSDSDDDEVHSGDARMGATSDSPLPRSVTASVTNTATTPLPERANLLTRNFVAPWPEMIGSFSKNATLVTLWNDAGAKLGVGVHLREGTRLFRVFSGGSLVKIVASRGSMLHGVDGQSEIINVPRGVILSIDDDGPGEPFSRLAVTYDSPHLGVVSGTVESSNVKEGALSTVRFARRVGIVVSSRAMLYKLNDAAPALPQPWGSTSTAHPSELSSAAVLPSSAIPPRSSGFEVLATLAKGTEVDVLRSGPTESTNGEGPSSWWEVQTRRPTGEGLRGFMMVRVYERGAKVDSLLVSPTGEVWVTDDGKTNLTLVDTRLPNAALSPTIMDTLLSRAGGAPTTQAYNMQRDLERRHANGDVLSEQEKFVLFRTLHWPGEWHETNTTGKYVAANHTSAWLQGLVALYRSTVGRQEYVLNWYDARTSEDEFSSIIQGVRLEATNDFMSAAAKSVGWGDAGRALIDQTAVKTFPSSTHVPWCHGQLKTTRLADSGVVVDDVEFDAAGVTAFVFDTCNHSENYAKMLSLLFEHDLFQGKRDSVRLGDFGSYYAYFCASMSVGHGAGSDHYAGVIYPDTIITFARMSEFDRTILAAAAFVVEGVTVSMTVDQLVEKLNGVLRTRFTSFHKGVEQAIRAFSVNLIEHMQLRTGAQSPSRFQFVDLSDISAEPVMRAHIVTATRFYMQNCGVTGIGSLGENARRLGPLGLSTTRLSRAARSAASAAASAPPPKRGATGCGAGGAGCRNAQRRRTAPFR